MKEKHYIEPDEFEKIYWIKNIDLSYLNNLWKEHLIKEYHSWLEVYQEYEDSSDSEKEYQAQIIILEIAKILDQKFWVDTSGKVINKTKLWINEAINKKTNNTDLLRYEELALIIDRKNNLWVTITMEERKEFDKLKQILNK